MKKLLVHSSELPQDVTDNIEVYSTMQMAYGLYEFKREKLVDEICKTFNLTYIGEETPLFLLEDSEGRTLSLIMKEETFG